MDESRAAEQPDCRTQVLFDSPRLRPLVHWVSERPVRSIFVGPFTALAWYFLLKLTLVTAGELLTLLGALLAAVFAVDFAHRIGRDRRAERCRRFPREPWRHDRAWDEKGQTRSWFVRLAEAMDPRGADARIVTIVMVVCGVVSVAGRLWWTGFVFYGVLVTWVCVLAWRVHGAGDSRLAFSKFPFHPGERLTLYFAMSAGGAQFQEVRFRLFHVTEYRGGTFGWQRGTRMDFTIPEHRPTGPPPGPDFDVEVTVDLPPDVPGTRLTDAEPAYWVLEVRGVTTAGPYVERFLVPIYEIPAASPSDGVSAE